MSEHADSAIDHLDTHLDDGEGPGADHGAAHGDDRRGHLGADLRADRGVDECGRLLVSRLLAAAHAQDHANLAALLDPLDAVQLREVVTVLATRASTDPVADVAGWGSAPVIAEGRATSSAAGPRGGAQAVCAHAAAAAAAVFGTTPQALRGRNRSRPVTDARAVAMTAARATGLSLPAIAGYFDKDHTTVIHAVRRTRDQARLNDAAARIADYLETTFAARLPGLAESAGPGGPSSCASGDAATDRSVLLMAPDRGVDRRGRGSAAHEPQMCPLRFVPSASLRYSDTQ